MADAKHRVPHDYARRARNRLATLTADLARGTVARVYESATDAVLRQMRAVIGRRYNGTSRERAAVEHIALNAPVHIARALRAAIAEQRVETTRVAIQALVDLVRVMEPSVATQFGARVERQAASRQLPAIEEASRERIAEWTTRTRSALSETVKRADTVASVMALSLVDLTDAWRGAQRVAVTDLAGTYNAAADASVDVLVTEHRATMKRWTECIDDVTGRPLDNRVAADSVAMHGQLAPPQGVFTMPSSEAVSAKRWGMTFPFPPNRPYDRAIVTPWMPHWGVPGWEVHNGTRVDRRGLRR